MSRRSKPYLISGAPTDGTSGTLAKIARGGAIALDETNFLIYQNTGTRLSPVWTLRPGGQNSAGFPRVGVLTESVLASALTDGGAAVGTKVLAGQIPAKAIYLYTKVKVSAGFAGDVSAVAVVGDGSDADRYNTGTPSVFAAAANGVEMGAPSGTRYHATAQAVTITITSSSDITLVLAGGGVLEVSLYYLETE